jgi:zinc protease
MTQEEFETTRTFLKSYSKLWAQNQSQRLGYAMDSRFYGTDDYLSTLPARLDALTLEQVNAAVKKHLRYDRLHIAVVTKGADAFLTALIENTPSPITYDAGSMPDDVLAEDKLVSVYKLNINRAASRIVDVGQMFK